MIRLDIGSGGMKYLPFAKKKLAQLLEFAGAGTRKLLLDDAQIFIHADGFGNNRIRILSQALAGWRRTTIFSGATWRLLTELYNFSGGVARILRDVEYVLSPLPDGVIHAPSVFVSEDASRYFEYTADMSNLNFGAEPYVMNMISGNEVVATYRNLFPNDAGQIRKCDTYFSNDGTEAVVIFNEPPEIVRLSISKVDGAWRIAQEFRVGFGILTGIALPGHELPFYLAFIGAGSSPSSGYSAQWLREYLAYDMKSVLLYGESGNIGFETLLLSLSLISGAITVAHDVYNSVSQPLIPGWDLVDLPAWYFMSAKSGDVYGLAVYIATDGINTFNRFSLCKNGVLVWNYQFADLPSVENIYLYSQGRRNISADGTKYSFVVMRKQFNFAEERRIDYFQYREGEANITQGGIFENVYGATRNQASRMIISDDGNAAIIRGLRGLNSAHVGYMGKSGFELIEITGSAYPKADQPVYPESRKHNQDFAFPNPYPTPTLLQIIVLVPKAGQSKLNHGVNNDAVTFSFVGLPEIPETPIQLSGYLGHQNFSH